MGDNTDIQFGNGENSIKLQSSFFFYVTVHRLNVELMFFVQVFTYTSVLAQAQI